MKNLKKITFILLIFTLAAFGCKKTEDPIVEPVASGDRFINKIDNGVDGYSILTYNANNQVTSSTSYNEDGTSTGEETLFAYNGTKLLTVISKDNGSINLKQEFIYGSAETPDSLIIWSDDGTGTLVRYVSYTLTFNANKLIKGEINFSMAGQSIVIGKTEFTYSDNNLTEVKTYEMDGSFSLVLAETELIQYDSKKNALHGIGLDYFFMISEMPFMSVNNITKYTYKDAFGNIDQGSSYTNAIEYNTNNYPTKITSNYDDGSTSTVVNYTYDCN